MTISANQEPTAGSDREGAEILALLKQGLSFDEISMRLMPAAEARLLRRVALLRQLDRPAFGVVAEEPGELDRVFSTLVEGDSRFEAVPRQPGTFTLSAKLRDSLGKKWDVVLDPASGRTTGVDVDEFRELQRRLAEHFAARGPGWELDHLHHLLAADGEAGIRRLEELLRERLPQPDEETQGARPATAEGARYGLALASAFDVVEAAEKQLPYLPAAGQLICGGARRLVDTWQQWSDAWYRTRRYVARQQVHQWFFELLAPEGKRILEIHAPGGSGKTMSLRWLIASHSIARRRPIAHLDFDQLLGRLQLPWQLLLRCAEQLDRQLAGGPFASLIAEGQDLEESLRSRRGRPESLDESQLASFADDFPRRFGRILATVSAEVVTIVVDTFEEAMIRSLTPVPAFVAMLVRFAEACPGLRLILSGRYPLGHRGFESTLAKEFPAEYLFYAAQLRREEMPLFDRQEAGAYLARRGVALGEGQLDTVLGRAGALDEKGERRLSPFYLALLADLIEHRGPRQEIDVLLQDLDHVRLIHLIERVISRIDSVGVRWLVRYGSVPRRLTREFFDAVLVPHLRQVHQGSWQQDDPRRDRLPELLRDENLYINQADLLADGPGALWERLRQFAGSAGTDSWVEENAGVLTFHANAREPMLALLREHAVLRSIHAGAGQFFEDKSAAAASPEERALHLREAVFHRFQWQGPAAAGFLAALLSQHGEAEDFVVVARLAEEIGGEEYRPAGGPALVGAALDDAYLRHFHAALALADLAADGEAADQGLSQAEKALAELAALRGAAPPELQALADLRLANPSRELLERAAAVLAEATPRDPALDRGLALAWLLLGDRRCVPLLAGRLAERLAERLFGPGHYAPPSRQPMTAHLVEMLARAQSSFGGDAGSYALWDSVTPLRSYEARPARQIARSVGWLMQSLMRWEAAGAWAVDQGVEESGDLELIALAAEGRTRPAAALAAVRLARNRRATTAAAGDTWQARALQLEAWLHAMLSDAGAAAEALAQAADAYRQAGDSAAAAKCLLIEARFWLHHHGGRTQASAALEKHQRSIHTGSGGDARRSLPERLLRFELQRPLSWGANFLGFEELLAAAEASDAIEDRLTTAMTLLAVLPEASRISDGERIAELLISTFERLPDAIARSSYPWLLRGATFTLHLGAGQERRLLELLDRGPGDALTGQPATPGDQAWALLAHAHLLRVCGRADRAHQNLGAARDYFARQESLTGMREVWQLEALLGQRHPSPGELWRGEAPLLESAVAVEQAEHALRRQDFAAARLWLEGIDLGNAELRIGSFGARGEIVLAQVSAPETTEPWSKGLESAQQAAGKAMALAPDPDVRTALGGTVPPAEEQGLEVLWSLYPRRLFDLGKASYSPTENNGWTAGLVAFAGSEMRQEIVEGFRAAPHGLVEAFSRYPDIFADRVFDPLVEPELPPGLGLLIDVAFSGEHLGGAGIPWELARRSRLGREKRPLRLLYRHVEHPAWRTAWLQRALGQALDEPLEPTGIWDGRTAEALQRFGNRLGTSDIGRLKDKLVDLVGREARSSFPLRVALFEASEHRQKGSSASLRRGVALSSLYTRHGIDFREYEGVGLVEFVRHPESLKYDVIHVRSSYIERRSEGDVVPDLAFEKSFGFRSFGEPRKPFPLLILDGPGQPEPVEQVRQIFLRNAAASLLARTALFPNILAIGLDLQPNLELLEKLIAGLQRRRSFFELYREIASPMPEIGARSLHQETGRLAPALWSADPDLCILSRDPEGEQR